MSKNPEQQKEPIPSNEFLMAEVAKIKAEIDKLKNLKEQTFGSHSVKRKPARKTVKKKTAAKRKPARKTVKHTSKTKRTRKPSRITRKSPTRSKKNTPRQRR